ncbi:dystrophia myotonica WD repeat-containing protein-like isoform X1 [Salvia splendens]|uniref:dystrophia myotonica WD repeat-containing protein-like isoform X1 n=1 Tax=Salvia splendens TaxID=180675 RepID=UPI001C266BCB|nr:dystrophia myotonica WD repeat-containing protein-like isoform X1 [Salvia splendens]
MMNSSGASNNMMSSSAASASGNNAPGPGLKTYFKTPEGKYKLQYEKTHPAGLLHYAHGKTVTQVTLAHLKEKPMQASSQSSSALGVSSGVRSAAARFLGGGNGSRALSFVGGNGGSKPVGGSSTRIGSLGASSSNNVVGNPNFDGKGTYLVFNVGDAIFVSDLNSQDKDPIKSIHFSNSNPVCHAYDPDAKDGHDLLIGLNSGDVYSVSLRQQLQDVGKKLVGAQHYNKDGSINNSRCTCIAWIPNGDGSFVVSHADGNMFAYEKNKDGSGDPSFPVIKDQTQFSVSHARYSRNPVARWHICQGSVNGIAFSADGAYIATVGRDGYLRVFDYKTEQLICGGKSYYGALLCCAWSMDGKYILTGGEDDLVQVWSMEDRKIVAWGEGHNSWVSGVAFDSYWLAPNSDGVGENIVYRFGSVGQDTQLLLWDLEMDELVVPVRRAPGGSPTFSTGSQSSHWDSACPVGTLQPSPSMRDVPKLSPLVAHRVHTEPLSGLLFTQESVLTVCREGHIKIWMRPGTAETQSTNSDSFMSTSLKEKVAIAGKGGRQ